MTPVRVYIKRVLPRTLFGRSLLIIIMPLILLQVVTSWIFYDRHWDTVTWRLVNSIAGDIGLVLDQMRDDPDQLDALFHSAKTRMDLDLVLKPGEILSNEPALPSRTRVDELLNAAMDERVKRPFRLDAAAFREEVVVDVQLADGVLRVIVPGRRVFSSTTYIFIMWMVGASLALFAVASIFMRNQIKPIRRLASAVDSFGKGREPESDFKAEGALEVRQAAQAFNLMSERIRRQVRQRTDMLSGVSHDLRTPLTRMKLQLAMLAKGPEIEELKKNVSEMESMVEGYLTFARGEGGEASVETDLSALVTEIGDRWKRTGAAIDTHVEGKIVTWLKVEAFKRCLENLIGNAHRYGGSIWIRCGVRGDAIEIAVDDDGPGIPEEDREEAFRPFVRLDAARNQDVGGTGLGLSIARDITRAHGGGLYLENSPYGGLRARIRLPM